MDKSTTEVMIMQLKQLKKILGKLEKTVKKDAALIAAQKALIIAKRENKSC